MYQFSECQTEEWKTVEELQLKICMLEAALLEVKPLDVAVLKGNDKLVRLYTGMPTYDSFMGFVEYLEPKASEMISWNSSRTKELSMKGKPGTRCFSSISIANQLFSVLIRLRLGLLAAFVLKSLKVFTVAYFPHGYVFYQKNYACYFPFHHVNKLTVGCLGLSKNIFRILGL